ncbi:MAG: DUF5132 domain-containing protein [Deltaproteobacteria bacterium]|nr:DUF5132 domain-containing protein [Deltaproteobacteria bacterium]
MRLIPLPTGMQLVTGLAIGAAAVLLAPVVVPVVAGVAKSLAKAGIKGGLIVYEKGKIAMAEAMETVEDLTAEVKAEMAEEHAVDVAPKKKAVARRKRSLVDAA